MRIYKCDREYLDEILLPYLHVLDDMVLIEASPAHETISFIGRLANFHL